MVLGAEIQCRLFLQPSVPVVSSRQALWGMLGQGNHLGRLAKSAADGVVPGTQLALLTEQGQGCAKGVAAVAK